MELGWYVLRGDNQVGPFNKIEILKMRQTKEIQDYDYIWCDGMEEWKRINDVVELKSQIDSGSFFQRRYPRAKLLIPIWVHDHKEAWSACSVTLSQGGAGLLVSNPLLLPGQEVALHFKSTDENEKSFNLKAEIVGKKFSREVMTTKSKVHYSSRFIDVPGDVMDYIKLKVRAKVG